MCHCTPSPARADQNRICKGIHSRVRSDTQQVKTGEAPDTESLDESCSRMQLKGVPSGTAVTQGHYMASVSLPQSHVGNITRGDAEITTSTRKDMQRHHFNQFAEEQDDVSPVLRLAIAQRRDEWKSGEV